MMAAAGHMCDEIRTQLDAMSVVLLTQNAIQFKDVTSLHTQLQNKKAKVELLIVELLQELHERLFKCLVFSSHEQLSLI